MKLKREPLKFVAPSLGTLPEIFPNRMINKATAKAFSEFWFQGAEASSWRTAEHHPVLPPARHRR
jgi:hypothetical protein